MSSDIMHVSLAQPAKLGVTYIKGLLSCHLTHVGRRSWWFLVVFAWRCRSIFVLGQIHWETAVSWCYLGLLCWDIYFAFPDQLERVKGTPACESVTRCQPECGPAQDNQRRMLILIYDNSLLGLCLLILADFWCQLVIWSESIQPGKLPRNASIIRGNALLLGWS